MRFKPYLVALSCLALVGVGASHKLAVGQIVGIPLPSGADCFQSDAVLSLVLPGATRPTEVILSGPTIVKRDMPQGNTIPTEILMMTLTGFHPEIGNLRVCKRKDRPSPGQIIVRNPRRGTADSFFDVFAEIDVTRQNQTINLRMESPVRMSVENININRLPPVGKEYKSQLPRTGIPLLMSNGQPSGMILKAVIHRVIRQWDNCPPLEGVDCFDSEAQLEIDFTFDGIADEVIRLTGPTLVKRSHPGDNDCDGLAEIETEIVALQLTGPSRVLGPIILVNDADMPSNGQVEQRRPSPAFFPAQSFFDVFFEVQTTFGTAGVGQTQPRAVVDALPPLNRPYRAPHAATVFDPITGQPIADILGVRHIPRRQLEWQPTFPPAGVDDFNSRGAFEICAATQQGTPDTERCIRTTAFGPTRVLRSNPITDPQTGLMHVDTEILSMNLTGTIPPGVFDPQQGARFQVIAGQQMNVPIPSRGFIQQRRVGFPLPAQSCFDVYFIILVQVGTQTLTLCPRPEDAVRLCSIIYSIPPRTPYCPPGQTAIFIPLFDCSGGTPTGNPVAFIKVECHLPI
ncbi:MAG: DUF6073 family protein [Abditibacteriales bacterium]|nr:DUF6073 family protein [Abditibacteriales bacterium]MDW8367095.1 DUF6073 family protein [Abditibacteriales bacterium]